MRRFALQILGWIYRELEDFDRARQTLSTSLELSTALGEPAASVRPCRLDANQHPREDWSTATVYLSQAQQQLTHALGLHWDEAMLDWNLGLIAEHEDRPEVAVEHFQKSHRSGRPAT